MTDIHTASSRGDQSCVQELVASGISINQRNEHNNTPLHHAALNAHLCLVSWLIARGADVNAVGQYGRTPIMAAGECRTDNAAVIHTLVAAGADVNQQAEDHDPDKNQITAAHGCCAVGTLLSLQALLDNGADLGIRDENQDLPIHCAARYGQASILEFLLSRPDADLHVLGNCDHNLLLRAAECESDNSVIITMLIQKGLSVNGTSDHNSTALTIASEHGHVKTIGTLLQHGANPNCTDNDGDTPLYLAILHGEPNAIPLLVQHGADVNKHLHGGNSCMHHAVLNNQIECVRQLLRCNAKYDVKNNAGQLPVDIAKEKGYDAILDILSNIDSIG